MKKVFKISLCLLIFSFSLSLTYAQSDQYLFLYNAASELEKSGSLKEALTEYKRYIFMQDYVDVASRDDNMISKSFFALSRIYEKNNTFDLSLSYFEKGMNIALKNQFFQSSNSKSQLQSDAFELQKKHISLLLKDATKNKTNIINNYSFAKYIFLDDFNPKIKYAAYCAYLENLINTSSFEQLALAFNEILAFQSEQNQNHQTQPLFTKDEIEIFNENLSHLTNFKGKNPILAGCLSIIPGLGQLYAQNYKDALNAFLLNGALIGVSVYSLVSLNIWDFSLIEFSPTFRFYRGNLINAQKHTYTYNENKTNEYKKELLTIIYNANERIHFENEQK